MRLAGRGEFALLERLGLLPPPGTAPAPGRSGDDAAALPWGPGFLLFTADALVEGVHFRRDFVPARDLGYKALAVNASDVAAMGGTPWCFTVSLVAPGTLDEDWVAQLYQGLDEAASRFGCHLAGGDTAGGRDVVVSVALLGRADRPVYRSGARPGDDLYVSGWPGESAAGLALLERGERSGPAVERHLRPEPRLALGAALARGELATAMLDVSDGLLQDLGHLLRASAVAAEVWAERIPLSPALEEAARAVSEDPLALALAGGEDYELLFTAPPDRAAGVARAAEASAVPVTRIGRIVPGTGLRLLEQGRPRPLPRRTGFDHFADPTAPSHP